MNCLNKDNIFIYTEPGKNNVIINTETLNSYKVTTDISSIIWEYINNSELSLIKSKYNKTEKELEEIFNAIFHNDKSNVKYDDCIGTIRLNVSNTCNMKCTYCYANGGNYSEKPSLMSIETGEKIVNTIHKYFKKAPKIVFFGGEPLLNYELIKILSNKLKGLDPLYTFGMISNYYETPADLSNLLMDYNFSVTASIDGPPEIHNLNRIDNLSKGTYDSISRNIKDSLSKTSQPEAFEVTYTKQHKERNISRKDVVEFLNTEFGVKHIIIANNANDFTEDIDKQDIDKDIQLVFDYFMRENNPVFVINNVSIPLAHFLMKKNTKHFCSAGINEICITSEGDIYPCQLFIGKKDFLIGNIVDDEQDIINKINDFKDRISPMVSKDSSTKCSSCISNWWCHICIGKEYANTNNLVNINDDFCEKQNSITLKVLCRISEILLDDNLRDTFYKNINELENNNVIADSVR